MCDFNKDPMFHFPEILSHFDSVAVADSVYENPALEYSNSYQAMFQDKVELSPQTLRKHNSLVLSHLELDAAHSSSGVPPLTDLTSSNASNDHESALVGIRSSHRTSSDWEFIAFQNDISGHSSSLLDMKARILEARFTLDTASIDTAVLPVANLSAPLLVLVPGIGSPSEMDEFNTTPTLFKQPSMSSTVIINSISRQSPGFSIGSAVPFYEESVLEEICAPLPRVESTASLREDTTAEFRRRMGTRIRKRLDSMLSDLDVRIAKQKSILEHMQM